MVEYAFEPQNQRSAAYLDGQLIGECVYQVRQNAWLIVHTEVAPEFGGQGIARKLVMMVADQAADQGIEVVPICSYAVKVLG
ncbi:N-acetyltransferase [Erysipelotrichaceae bacterium RD49]|nr:N-acetyltransferase [Erysipelotrichaceae bacterium RD49]